MTTRRRPWHLLDQTLLDYPKYPEDNYCIDCGAVIAKDESLCESCRLKEQNGDTRLHEEL